MEKPYVFISYARADAEVARRLYDALKRVGAVPWLDVEHLIPGQKWKPAIRAAIRNCRYFLALLSNNSVGKRGFVQNEVKIALEVLEEFPEDQIFIIPVRLDDCHPSYERLRDLHWVDLFPTWDNGWPLILRAIGIEHSETKEPDELDLFVRDHIDKSRFRKRKSWTEIYSLVFKEFLGDDTLYIFWNERDEILEKFYKTYGGVRWFGPERLSDDDKNKVKRYLMELQAQG